MVKYMILTGVSLPVEIREDYKAVSALKALARVECTQIEAVDALFSLAETGLGIYLPVRLQLLLQGTVLHLLRSLDEAENPQKKISTLLAAVAHLNSDIIKAGLLTALKDRTLSFDTRVAILSILVSSMDISDIHLATLICAIKAGVEFDQFIKVEEYIEQLDKIYLAVNGGRLN